MKKYPSAADIAEMKARGYDPITIAEAEQRAQRWTAALQVCQIIETAFTGVTLGDGIGLQEAQAHDANADAATCAAYRINDEIDDWHRIPAEALNRCHSSLSFFDAEGMRFHLPAYLIADLRGDYHFGIAFCLTHLSDYSISKFTLLSQAQRAAVRAFLLHIAEDPDYEFESLHIIRALNEFWTADQTA
jgi:hypothetical protein